VEDLLLKGALATFARVSAGGMSFNKWRRSAPCETRDAHRRESVLDFEKAQESKVMQKCNYVVVEWWSWNVHA